jgi:hypothetical protein
VGLRGAMVEVALLVGAFAFLAPGVTRRCAQVVAAPEDHFDVDAERRLPSR